MRLLLLLPFISLSLLAVPISKDGTPLATITTQPADNADLIETAELLGDYLQQITGAAIPIGADAGPQPNTIVLEWDGSAARLAGLGPGAYQIKAAGSRVHIVGASPKAVRDGMHDLLHQVGMRWLQPSERWTVVPKEPSLTIADLDLVTKPGFAHRDIWYAYGPGIDPSRETLARDYLRWKEGNRLGGHAKFNSGHTYPHTVGLHKEEFESHPEYFALKEDGTRTEYHTHKSLCYSNPRVAEIFVEDKINELRKAREKNPFSYTVSMDPNDGSTECYCKPCQALGNGSDQCLYLANQVAKALRKEFPDAIVSFYVYASHRMPPTKVKAEPNVYVQVATAFNKTNFTLDELIDRWRQTVAGVGIRDYLGVMAWDWGLPGRARGTRFGYVREAVPDFHKQGGIAYNAETNINWGASGPATTTAARLLWSPDADAQALYDDWFAHAYGPAAETMKQLHAKWEGSQSLTRHNLHTWFRLLDKAMKEAADASPEIQARLTDMVVLLHYSLLYKDWEVARAVGEREAAYEALMPLLVFTWQTRHRGIVHAYALQRRLVNSGDKVLRPLRPEWRFNQKDAPWKVEETLSDEQLRAIFQKDLSLTPADARRREFDGPMVLTENPGTAPAAAPAGYLRYGSTWHVVVPKGSPLKLELPMDGVRSRYKLSVEDSKGKQVWRTAKTITTEARYDRVRFALPVTLPAAGSYTFAFTAGEDYRPDFPMDWHIALRVTETVHPMIRFYGPATFYIPKGTKEVYFKTDGRLSLILPGSNVRQDFSIGNEDPELGCIVIPVEGETPQIWQLDPATSGRTYALNVPSFLGRVGQQQLLPQSAVE